MTGWRLRILPGYWLKRDVYLFHGTMLTNSSCCSERSKTAILRDDEGSHLLGAEILRLRSERHGRALRMTGVKNQNTRKTILYGTSWYVFDLKLASLIEAGLRMLTSNGSSNPGKRW